MIHVTKVITSEGFLLAVFSPGLGWAGPIIVDGDPPQLYPGREIWEVSITVCSPQDAANKLGLQLPIGQQPPM